MTGLVALLVAFPAPGMLAADVSWRVVRGDVRVVCPLTVGGSFEAKTGAMRGTVTPGAPGTALAGDLSVDLGTLDTGIGLRNDHLRREYLEVGRGEGFDRAVLSEIRLGDADPRGFQGKTPFTGTFLLHGTKKPIAGQATVRREGRTVRVEASFPVTVSDFGIAKPQYLGVGVKDQVSVVVSLVAEPGEDRRRRDEAARPRDPRAAPRRDGRPRRADVPVEAVQPLHQLPLLAHRRRPADSLRPLALAPGALDDGQVRRLGASAGQGQGRGVVSLGGARQHARSRGRRDRRAPLAPEPRPRRPDEQQPGLPDDRRPPRRVAGARVHGLRRGRPQAGDPARTPPGSIRTSTGSATSRPRAWGSGSVASSRPTGSASPTTPPIPASPSASTSTTRCTPSR